MDSQATEKPDAKPQSDPDYRKWLVAAEQKSQDDYDKTILSLSGGALGISFVFVKDIIGPGEIAHSWYLLAAWLSWALSSFAVLASFFMSHLALREAIRQCDEGAAPKKPGGFYSVMTQGLNIAGAVAFLTGVCFMAAFVYTNLSKRETQHVGQTISQSATNKPAAKATAKSAPAGRAEA